MKMKRVYEMSQLERAIVKMLFDDVCKTPDDGVWRKYEKNFTYEKQAYIVKCSFKLSNQNLTYKNLFITQEVKEILLH